MNNFLIFHRGTHKTITFKMLQAGLKSVDESGSEPAVSESRGGRATERGKGNKRGKAKIVVWLLFIVARDNRDCAEPLHLREQRLTHAES